MVSEDDLEPLAIAKCLKAVCDNEQPSIVLMGKQSIDGDNNQTSQMLGALTGYGQGTNAFKVELDGDKVNVVREVGGGLQTVSLNTPAIVSTDLHMNEPRYASLPNIMKAKKKPLDSTSPADLGVDTAPRVKTLKVEPPAERQGGIKVEDVATLVAKLKEAGAI